MGDRLFDFMDNPAKITFGGRGGIGDVMAIISGPRHTGKGIPSCTA